MIVMNTHITNKDSTNMIIGGLTLAFFVIFCLITTIWNAKTVRGIHKIKRAENYEFDENDIHFDNNKMIFYLVFMCFISGILSGILGIAGGTIMSPLFLTLGMLPSVIAATN